MLSRKILSRIKTVVWIFMFMSFAMSFPVLANSASSSNGKSASAPGHSDSADNSAASNGQANASNEANSSSNNSQPESAENGSNGNANGNGNGSPGDPQSDKAKGNDKADPVSGDPKPSDALLNTALTTNSSTTSSSTAPGGQTCDGGSPTHGSTGTNPYQSNCGGPSLNGNGTGGHKPCAGCVGNADDKNPKGQAPGPNDHNKGYECDGNNGIAKGNPAHTVCKPPTTTVHTGGQATISSLPCDQTTTTVSVKNLNDAAAGNRTFTLTLDGVGAGSLTVAPGASSSTTITIPDDATAHTVAVTSPGWTPVTKSLTVTHCAGNPHLQGSSSIGSLACGVSTVAITLHNGNDALGGPRIFTISLDGLSTTRTVPSLTTITIGLAIPADGQFHTVVVTSPGWPTSSATLKVNTTCTTTSHNPDIPTEVLGVKFVRSPNGTTNGKTTAVLGARLPRTGGDMTGPALASAILLLVGIGMEVGISRRRKALKI